MKTIEFTAIVLKGLPSCKLFAKKNEENQIVDCSPPILAEGPIKNSKLLGWK